MDAPPTSPSPVAPLDLDLDLIAEALLPEGVAIDGLRGLAAFVLEREGAEGPWLVTIVLTDNARLRTLHRDFLGVDSATDVMTFPHGEGVPGQGASRGGEIVVSVERARDQAAEYGQTAAGEVRFLVTHGLLHLCGWDDASPEDRSRMLDRQSELLAAVALFLD